MHRNDLLAKLHSYQLLEPQDDACRQRFLKFVLENPACFERSLAIGHVTGSAWITNRERTRFLLTYHKKLEIWLQLGGHADGDADIVSVALKEAGEESGLKEVRLVSNQIFDLDIHNIPEYRGVPQHLHYDVRFLVEADDRLPLLISDESHDLRWLLADEVRKLTQEESILRMLRKTYLFAT